MSLQRQLEAAKAHFKHVISHSSGYTRKQINWPITTSTTSGHMIKKSGHKKDVPKLNQVTLRYQINV